MAADVASYSGDGILVYFGYPTAHENDAERAVRASLELLKQVPTLKTKALNGADEPDGPHRCAYRSARDRLRNC